MNNEQKADLLPSAILYKETVIKPDMGLVNDLVKIADNFIGLIEKDHKSQSSLSRQFERGVLGISNPSLYNEGDSRKGAYRYFNWLVTFQQHAINIPLLYCFDALFAALDFCKANLEE